ncbi:MAG: hypothetical protein K8R87_01995 [Verrucomicrobia bacterium]|nr:hypothetical protein [Verrucomicrobiota bacterium]
MKPTPKTLLVLGGIITAISLSSCGEKKAEQAAPTGGSAAAPAKTALPPGETENLDLEKVYPKPMFVGTPIPTGNIPNMEKADPDAVKKRDVKVPKGTVNVAKGKPVTSSDPAPFIGTFDLVTDGDADGADGNYVELSPGPQWIQVDLGASMNVWKVLLWHFHKNTVIYFSVVVQVSDDPEFKIGVTTLFNNDIEDKLKLGTKGTDKNYIETNHGRFIEGNGAKGRYVRCWSAGNSANEMNHYVELQVYGTPAK